MERIYLDNASTSFPKAEGVAEAMCGYVQNCGCNVSRGGYDEAYQAEEQVLDTRQRLTRLFHGPDCRNVVFTKNITESLNVLLKGLLRSGDHVPAVRTAACAWRRRRSCCGRRRRLW